MIFFKLLVRVVGFEPTTSRAQTGCATGLRYTRSVHIARNVPHPEQYLASDFALPPHIGHTVLVFTVIGAVAGTPDADVPTNRIVITVEHSSRSPTDTGMNVWCVSAPATVMPSSRFSCG